ncbi:MAG TPA: hypothetical protein VF069_12575 [Streptosporangiaceae bacterium]
MDVFKHWLSEGSQLFTLLGLSVLGVASSIRWIYVWIRRRLNVRRDRARLAGSYAVWRRLADQTSSHDAKKSLVAQIEATQGELLILARQALAQEIRNRLDNVAFGTIDLTYNDLLVSDGLIIPTRYLAENDVAMVAIERSAGAGGRWRVVQSPEAAGALVVGNPGCGKSMLCRVHEHAWLASQDAMSPVVTIDAMDFSPRRATAYGAAAVGSKEWLVGVLEQRLFNGSLGAFERRALAELFDKSCRIVIDSLDEIAEQLGRAEMMRFLRSWIFRRCEFATVRTSYFESELYQGAVLRAHPVVHQAEPDEDRINEYILALCQRTFPHDVAVARAATTEKVRRSSPGLQELTHNPMLLTMCAALPDFAPVGTIDVSTIYRRFVRLSLTREIQAGRMSISVEVVLSVLSELAWRTFSGTEHGLVGRRSLLGAVGAVREVSETERIGVVDALQSCPLITLHHVVSGGDEEYEANFYHKSFVEYFVARRLEEWLCGRSPVGNDFFDHIDTPEVTFFVKEAIFRLSADRATKHAAAMRLRTALAAILHAGKEAPDERTAREKTFAAGQIAYYLGMLSDDETRAWLERRVVTDGDFWIRRCAVIGLAFGGAPQAFHAFIDEMRDGISRGDFTMARKNIGVELGFYGDQEFDRLDPTADKAGSVCTRLVSRSCLELSLNVEAANWRMILFNLLYLAKHRTASFSSFNSEVQARKLDVLESLTRLESVPANAVYPEIAEMRELIIRY